MPFFDWLSRITGPKKREHVADDAPAVPSASTVPPAANTPTVAIAKSPPAPPATAVVRSMLFIDEPNVARSLSEVRSHGKDLDYNKLREYFSAKTPLAGAFFYTGYEDNQLGMKAFFRKLTTFGYEVVQVKGKRYRDGSVKRADPDIKIVTDMLIKFSEYDEAILVSGDGDFTDTMQQLMKRGKKVKIVSMRSRLAQELRESGAEIIFLENILPGLLMERHMRSGPASQTTGTRT